MNAKWKPSHLKGSSAHCYICDRCGYVLCGETSKKAQCPSCKSIMTNAETYKRDKEGE